MQSIQYALASGNENEAARLVDFDILARYFIANQLMLDMESFHGSCYLNRQRGATEKWKFGPVWDFGNAFASGRADKPRFIFDHPDFSQVWIGEFYSMPEFVGTVKRVWQTFLAEGPEVLKSHLAKDAGDIASAAICDGRRWPAYSHADIAGEAKKLESWLQGSINWLKTQWGDNSGVDVARIEKLSVSTDGHNLIICSATDRRISLTSLDGTTQLLTLHPGINSFTLSPGIYFCFNHKILNH